MAAATALSIWRSRSRSMSAAAISGRKSRAARVRMRKEERFPWGQASRPVRHDLGQAWRPVPTKSLLLHVLVPELALHLVRRVRLVIDLDVWVDEEVERRAVLLGDEVEIATRREGDALG